MPQRLKRVIGIDVETRAVCDGTMRIIACIEDPIAIRAIFAYLAGKARPLHAPRLPPRPTIARVGNAVVTRRAVRDAKR